MFLTATTESRAAVANISAQETRPVQELSNWLLMVSITLNPLNELLLGAAVFSPVKFAVSSSSTEASHPYICLENKQLLKVFYKFSLT